MKCLLPLSVFFIAGALAGPSQAASSFDACTGFITSLPAVISTQGTWCLKSDLATAISNGYAIQVNNNNVTIDCNGFKLGGLAAGAGTLTRGIAAEARLNTTVRDCNLRGFYAGIEIGGAPSAGHLIEGNRIEGSTTVGVVVNGSGTQVRGNRVLDTGLSTSITGSGVGILGFGAVEIVDNLIDGVTAVPGGGGNVESRGILVFSANGTQVAGNRVRNLVRAGDGTAVGISLVSSIRSDVRGNFLLGPGTTGISCGGTDGVYDNHVNGFTTALLNCNDNGNVVVP